jgi:Skp family chaperone for outer membrane proteins
LLKVKLQRLILIVDEIKPLNEKLYPDIEKHKSLQKQIEIELPICKVECFSLEKKIDEYEKLSSQIKLRIEEINVLFEKRKAEIIEPVKKKITDKIKEFAKQKGYVIVVEQSSINEGVIICGEIADITKEFIKFCNEEFEKEKLRNK